MLMAYRIFWAITIKFNEDAQQVLVLVLILPFLFAAWLCRFLAAVCYLAGVFFTSCRYFFRRVIRYCVEDLAGFEIAE